ncbi:uncharacterized protein [Ptychodera flava]|uniref:uncharacterized protein isoform X2 n=1 Tax=Ptychodera flava TaxID=63121 RepID=UPI00396A55B2
MTNGAIKESHHRLSKTFNTVISENKLDSTATQESTESEDNHNSTSASTEVFIQIDVKVTAPADDLSKVESCDSLTRLNEFLSLIGSRCQCVKNNSPLKIRVSCPTLQSVEGLWESYKSDFLLQVICSDVLLKFDSDGICDKVIIESWRYRKAKLELNSLYLGNHGNNGNGSVRDPVNTKPDNKTGNGRNGGNQVQKMTID